MTSPHLYLVRTAPLGYVLGYYRRPVRSPNGDWPMRGRIHPFSPRDAEWLRFYEALPEPNAIRSFTLDASDPERTNLWAFRYVPARSVVELLIGGVVKQSFCEEFLRFAHAAGMPADVPLYWVWDAA